MTSFFRWPFDRESQNLLVDIVNDGQKIVSHCLQSQFVQQWCDTIESTIQNKQLGTGFLRSFAHGWLVGFVGIQFLLNQLSQFNIAIPITE